MHISTHFSKFFFSGSHQTSNNNTSAGDDDDNGVDPLDAFMAGVSKKIEHEKSAPKQQRVCIRKKYYNSKSQINITQCYLVK